LLGERIQRDQFRFFRDADAALTLNVGMAAYRADAGAELADVSPQQQEIAKQTDVLDARRMVASAPSRSRRS